MRFGLGQPVQIEARFDRQLATFEPLAGAAIEPGDVTMANRGLIWPCGRRGAAAPPDAGSAIFSR